MSLNQFKIFVGSDNFKKMITESDIFVDKSLFIQEIIDNGEEATLITKARRWGKTLNLDMLKTFLSIDIDEQGNPKIHNSNKVFFEGGVINASSRREKKLDGLAISKIDNGSYVTEHQGRYPVIYITFKDIMGSSVEEIKDRFKIVIKDLYKEYRFLKGSAKLHPDEKADFQKYIDQDYQGILIESSIKFLSELLHKHYEEKVYILVDEYDKPINYLLETGITRQDKGTIKGIADLITSILSSCGKTNPHLNKIILTGIFDTLKKEGGSGFNNIKVYGISDIKYGKSFGFSEKEVDQLVSKLEFGENEELIKQNIKSWYNGYTMPVSTSENMQVYTPWAVMNYLSSAYNDNNFQPANYWSKSGASVILQNLLRTGVINDELTKKFNLISQDNEVQLSFDESTSLFRYEFTPGEFNEKLFTYLLVNSGYLTFRKDDSGYFFKIPNYEVKKEFLDVIENELQNTDKAIRAEKDATIQGILTQHKEVLLKHIDTLQSKDKAAQAFNAIIAKNSDKLNKVFDTAGILKCEGDDFNFFHVGAIVGDNDVFTTLMEKCNKSLLSSRDKVQGLKAINYAYLSGNRDIMDQIIKEGSSMSVQVPDYIDSLICAPLGALYVTYNLLAVSALTAALKVALKAPGFKWAFVVVTTTSIVKELTKYIGDGKFGLCEKYNHYAKIDTTSPNNFNSLIQFEKYVLDHDNSYISFDALCHENYNDIKNISILIPGYDGENKANFTLCESYEPIDYTSYLLDTILVSGIVMVAAIPILSMMTVLHD